MTEPTPEQLTEIKFLGEVQPTVHHLLNCIEEDSARMGVTPAWFQRAVWVWAMQRHAHLKVLPLWMETELTRMENESRGKNAGEG